MKSRFYKTKILALYIFFILSLIFSFQNANCQYRKSPEQIKRELRQLEMSAPLDHVKVSSMEWSVNLASNTVVKGYLRNNATISGFKNITLKATFFSKTGSYVSEETWTVLEYLAPGSSIDYRRTISGYWKDAKRCSVEVISAESY